MVAAPGDALERVAERVKALAASYEPPDFAEVPGPDAAFFLTALDHGTGYSGSHMVDGSGPFEGSALLWALGLAAERKRPALLSALSLAGIEERGVAELFGIDGETARDPGERARLWRDAAAHLIDRYQARAEALIEAAQGRLGGGGGLLARLAEVEAYSDPLAKKSFLVCKIWERRGWLAVRDPDQWEVCADSVLMRLALRSGLVEPGELDRVRADTRSAFKAVAERSEVSPPLLDDLLWELGRDDRDLLGRPAGDLREPARRPGAHFY